MHTIILVKRSLFDKKKLPMDEFDTLNTLDCACSACDDEQLMMNEVICGDAELFYMDCYFRELFLYKQE